MNDEMLRRLARAVHLTPTHIVHDRYVVSGGERQHRVDARTNRCDCPDYQIRRTICKHIYAVKLARGDTATLRALREIIPIPPRTTATA